MDMEHIVVMEPVRAYLLGKLDEASCASLEEKYFTSPACLARIEEIEAALITDYLEQRLPGSDKIRFEARYLTIPALFQKVLAARSARALRPLPAPTFGLQWQLAFAVLVIVSGFAIWSYVRGSHPQPPLVVQDPRQLPTLALAISPGIPKGNAPQSVLSLPASATHVKLALELPGRSAQLDCLVRLVLPGPNGRNDAKVVPLGEFRSEAAPEGQKLTVLMESSSLIEADYLLEVANHNGTLLEVYSLRVKLP